MKHFKISSQSSFFWLPISIVDKWVLHTYVHIYVWRFKLLNNIMRGSFWLQSWSMECRDVWMVIVLTLPSQSNLTVAAGHFIPQFCLNCQITIFTTLLMRATKHMGTVNLEISLEHGRSCMIYVLNNLEQPLSWIAIVQDWRTAIPLGARPIEVVMYLRTYC